MNIRQATLDDTQSISELFRARIERWQRMGARGQVEDLPYEALRIYERWLHGGPWMSIESGAIWLSHLLHGAGLPFVLERDNRVMAYAEVHPGAEPQPYGEHWYLAHRVIQPYYISENDDDIEDALMAYVLQQVRPVGKLLAASPSYDAEAALFYQRYGLSLIGELKRYSITAQTGQSFYKAIEHPNPDALQIDHWAMPVGRLTSARHQWQTLWPALWDAIPEMKQRKTHRLRLIAAGQDAFVCCQQQLFDPRSADVYCWSPKPLTAQLYVAIRDWAHRAGYRTLIMTVDERTAKLFGSDAESNPYVQHIYGVDIP